MRWPQQAFLRTADVEYDQQHTLVRMRQVSVDMISVFTAPASFEIARDWADEKQVRNIAVQQERLNAEVPEGNDVFEVQLRQNDERYFDTSCGCEETTPSALPAQGRCLPASAAGAGTRLFPQPAKLGCAKRKVARAIWLFA